MNTTEFNRNFFIVVRWRERRVNSLVGISGLKALFGEDLAARLMARAEKSRNDKILCRLRRGAQVIFYSR
ncbi:MAG: hypothetical protein HUJ63_13370 [Enterococcus sp.]|nr:hypothetical protein [Enterococcus sp.]